MTQHYIGTKQVLAWPAEKDGVAGYGITYPDGYQSWSPKKQFESAYLAMGEGNDGSKITQGMVDGFILNIEAKKFGEKNTVVVATLANGFEIVESSSCVDPENFSMEIGTQICVDRIKNKVWHLLGFLLQTARSGVTFANTDCKLREPTIADQAETAAAQ